jgi:hypothetical protein
MWLKVTASWLWQREFSGSCMSQKKSPLRRVQELPKSKNLWYVVVAACYVWACILASGHCCNSMLIVVCSGSSSWQISYKSALLPAAATTAAELTAMHMVL